jgi:hypothetical protein
MLVLNISLIMPDISYLNIYNTTIYIVQRRPMYVEQQITSHMI